MPEEEINIFEPPAYALVVGLNQYGEEIFSELKCAEKDADDFGSFLIESGFFPASVKILKGPEANAKAIRLELKRIAEECQDSEDSNPLVIIFFSGHGHAEGDDNNKEYFLIPYGIDKDDLDGTAISNENFNKALRKIDTKRLVVFLDACHSGGLGGDDNDNADGEKGSNSTTVIYDAEKGLGEGNGRYIITSSQKNQSSWELKDKSNGIFTSHLIDILKNPDTAPELTGKEEIDMIDFFPVLRNRVQAAAKKERKKNQEPKKIGKEEESIIIAIKKKTKERKRSEKLREFLKEIEKELEKKFPTWESRRRDMQFDLDSHIRQLEEDVAELKDCYGIFKDKYLEWCNEPATIEDAAKRIKYFYDLYKDRKTASLSDIKKPTPVEKISEAVTGSVTTVSNEASKQNAESGAFGATVNQEKQTNAFIPLPPEAGKISLTYKEIKSILQPLTDNNYTPEEETLFVCLSKPVSDNDLDMCIQQIKNENNTKVLDEVIYRFKNTWHQQKSPASFTSIASLRNFETK